LIHCLLGVDRVVCSSAALRHADERRPPVIGVGRQLEEPVTDQSTHGGVHALSRQTHPPRNLRDRERSIRQNDGTEDLPSGRREALAGTQYIAGFEHGTGRHSFGSFGTALTGSGIAAPLIAMSFAQPVLSTRTALPFASASSPM
jgi:hypothetical protein